MILPSTNPYNIPFKICVNFLKNIHFLFCACTPTNTVTFFRVHTHVSVKSTLQFLHLAQKVGSRHIKATFPSSQHKPKLYDSGS